MDQAPKGIEHFFRSNSGEGSYAIRVDPSVAFGDVTMVSVGGSNIHIGANCRIGTVSLGNHVEIEDDVIIGDGANLGNGVYIKEGSIIGSRTQIGDDVAIFAGATIADDAFLGDGVLVDHNARVGNEAVIGAGAEVSAHAWVPDYWRIPGGAIVNPHPRTGEPPIVLIPAN